jgi:hypothetical protein
MKKLLVLGLLAGLAIAGRAADSFVQQLTPDERHAAGLDQLTPAQQAALDRLAERFAKEGAQVVEAHVREEAQVEVVKAHEEAKVEVAKAHEETKVEVAKVREETKVQVQTETKKEQAAKVGLVDAKAPPEVVHSKIKGQFEGWSGRTLFVLENGQQWVQTDTHDLYVFPPGPGPEVEIRHSSMGGWKLFLMPGGGRWVRVRRVN